MRDEIENQEICRKFVDREVIMNASLLMDDLIKANLISYDDIENLNYYQFYYDSMEIIANSYEEVQEFIDKYTKEMEKAKDDLLDALQTELDTKSEEEIKKIEDKIIDLEEDIEEYENLLEEMKNPESQMKEVFEWWFVTNRFFTKLKEKGEPVLHSDYGDLWGRCCTGQAIYMDGIIREICNDMKILVGQENDWSRK